jgi:hypothetical protein
VSVVDEFSVVELEISAEVVVDALVELVVEELDDAVVEVADVLKVDPKVISDAAVIVDDLTVETITVYEVSSMYVSHPGIFTRLANQSISSMFLSSPSAIRILQMPCFRFPTH